MPDSVLDGIPDSLNAGSVREPVAAGLVYGASHRTTLHFPDALGD